MYNWISVNDRLPEKGQEVICSDGDDSFGGVIFNNVFFEWIDGTRLYGPVTHWMPLPEPPK